MDFNCLKCKGKSFCGNKSCPYIIKAGKASILKGSLKEEFSGSSPSPFVGRYGYPKVNLSIMALSEQKEDAWLYDSPGEWKRRSFGVKDIIALRSELIGSKKAVSIKPEAKDRVLEACQETAMSLTHIDLEIKLKEKPRQTISYDSIIAPTGASAQLEKIRVESNPKIKRIVDKAVSDTDLKAADAINMLYKRGIDENNASKLLSVACLGIKKQRKLVPTRWSITATDDIIAKGNIEKIKRFKAIEDYEAYFASYFGNNYLILLFPEIWSYELFEFLENAEAKKQNNKTSKAGKQYEEREKHSKKREAEKAKAWLVESYTTDYEGYYGRKSYAENCAGGYYSVRLAITEKLIEKKRQASAIAIRLISQSYSIPLGVWVTREAAREALSKKPICFSSKELMLSYARAFFRKKLGCNIDKIIKNSKILSMLSKQKKLYSF